MRLPGAAAMRVSLSQFLATHAALLITLGLVPILEQFVTIEWSRPYCMNRTEGPLYATTGLPLPYAMPTGASSMQFDVMPQVYVLNMVILCLLAYPLHRVFVNRVGASTESVLRLWVGGVGLTLCVVIVAVVIFLLGTKQVFPVLTFGDSPYSRYIEFRPVAIRIGAGNDECTRSPYWFPQGWRGR
jgi:hypothetical protein